MLKPAYRRLALLGAAALCLCCLCACGVRSVPAPGNVGRRAQPPILSATEGGGYPLTIEGITLDPPFALSALTDNGFAVEGALEDELPPDELSEALTAAKGDTQFKVYMYNASGDMKPVKDCVVAWLDVAAPVQATLINDLQMGAKMDDVLLSYGDPEENYEDAGRDVFCYDTGLYMGLNLHFSQKSFELERIESFHIPSPSSGEGIASARVGLALDYQPPASLGTDAASGRYQLDGDLYQLPTPISAFRVNGWQAVGFETDQAEDESGDGLTVNGSGYTAVQLTRNGHTLYLLAYNLSQRRAALSDCFVTAISGGEGEDGASLCLPGGVRTGMTKAELEAAKAIGLEFDGISYNLYSNDERFWAMGYWSEETQTLSSLSLIDTSEGVTE